MPHQEPLLSRATLPLRARTSSGFSSCSKPPRRVLLILEELEPRNLLSLSNVLINPLLEVAPADAPVPSASPLAAYGYATYTPAQVRAAYGFSKLSYDGAGQTIAIVAAYDNPNIAGDLSIFDKNFGLPGQTVASVNQFFTKVNQKGQTSNYPAVNSLWATEIALDVEWAHAIAPGAKILLVEANTGSGADLLTAVNTARNTAGVSVVSMSWGTTEFNGETYYNTFFTTPAGHIGGNGQPGGITFVASAGDTGATRGAEWPAASPNVLSVGGTTLSITGSTYVAESVWSGGGGGYSKYEARPSWQTAQTTAQRSTPDVSYNANAYTGAYIYSSSPWGWSAGWLSVGGTSAGTPQWAGLIALANQARAQLGRPSLTGAQTALYAIPQTDFHDITVGSNGFPAKVGYDLASGRGSPYADRIVPDLLLVPSDPGYIAPGTKTSTTSKSPAVTPRFLDSSALSPNGLFQANADPQSAWAWITTERQAENSKTTQPVPLSSPRPGSAIFEQTSLTTDQAGTSALPVIQETPSGVKLAGQEPWQWSTDVFGPPER